jgi:hypothetical protein
MRLRGGEGVVRRDGVRRVRAAEVAETAFTAFTSRPKVEQVSGGWWSTGSRTSTPGPGTARRRAHTCPLPDRSAGDGITPGSPWNDLAAGPGTHAHHKTPRQRPRRLETLLIGGSVAPRSAPGTRGTAPTAHRSRRPGATCRSVSCASPPPIRSNQPSRTYREVRRRVTSHSRVRRGRARVRIWAAFHPTGVEVLHERTIRARRGLLAKIALRPPRPPGSAVPGSSTRRPAGTTSGR